MMKKTRALIGILLALAMAAGLFALRMPIAHAETFSQMKDSIPETVTFTIDGEAVEVPVILPDVETLPIGYICPLKVDKEKMRELFGDTIAQIDTGRLILEVGEPFFQQGGTTVYLESGIAPLVDVTPEQAGQLFLDIVEKSGLPLEYRAEKVLARSGRYETKKVEVSLVGKEEETKLARKEDVYPSFTQNVPDLSKPVAGKEAGAYDVIMTQMANGIPIHVTASPNGNGGFMGPYPALYLRSENDYYFKIVYTQQPCGTGEEPQLAAFETLVRNIQARIDEGWLRAVDSLELCYAQTFRLVNGKKIPAKEADENNPFGVLVPAWKVNGYDRIHLTNRVSSAFEDPTPFERYIQLPPKGYHVTYDALTGELWNRKGWND